MIDLFCPNCGAHLEFSDIGKAAALLCPFCGSAFASPPPDAAGESAGLGVYVSHRSRGRLRQVLSRLGAWNARAR